MRGNKARTLTEIKAAALESIKFSYAENRPTDWTCKSWEKGVAQFTEAAGQIADVMLSSMEDRGDVPYVKGKITGIESKAGLEVAEKFYEQMCTVASYRKKKVKLFVGEFKRRCQPLMRQWKEQAGVYFDLSRGRSKKGISD